MMSGKSTVTALRDSYQLALQRRIVELSVSRRTLASRRTELAERALEDAGLDRLRYAVLALGADRREKPASGR